MNRGKDIIGIARDIVQKEAAAVAALEQLLDEQFEKAVALISACKGRVVVSGIGKSAIVAQKVVATLNSTGTPAVFLHAADAIHGDLGMVQDQDVVMILSKSGESPEIKVLLSLIRGFGNPLIGMVGNLQSDLARQSDIVLNTTVDKEACMNNLAPTSRTTVQMVMGDALAITLMEIRGFGSEDFARFHPGGTLGKKLYLRVQDVYVHNAKPRVTPDTALKEVIIEITSKRLGAAAVTDEKGLLLGIITDGDLRRAMGPNLLSCLVADIMNRAPRSIGPDALAAEALHAMNAAERPITSLFVVDARSRPLGILHIHDLLRAGMA